MKEQQRRDRKGSRAKGRRCVQNSSFGLDRFLLLLVIDSIIEARVDSLCINFQMPPLKHCFAVQPDKQPTLGAVWGCAVVQSKLARW